ncbi:hypothetical protein M8C21_025993, partial [Ambrosia artemisiifolia]
MTDSTDGCRHDLTDATSIVSQRKTRGVARCKRKLKPEEMYIDLNENNLPIGKLQTYFDSWLGLETRTYFPEYWIQSHKYSKQRWHELWLHIKDSWHFQDDVPEKAIIDKAKKGRTDFISKELWRWYKRKRRNPCLRFSYFDASRWDAFVAAKSTKKAKEISEKARQSALANKNQQRIGRGGYRALEYKFHKVWPPIVDANPHLDDLDNRTRLYLAGRIRKDKQTGTYNTQQYEEQISALIEAEKKMKLDGTYGQGRVDPMIKVFGVEHGGRTRGVSSTIGHTKVKVPKLKRVSEMVEASPIMHMSQKRRVDASPGFPSSSCGSGASHTIYPEIEKLSRCQIFWCHGEKSADEHIADGQVYPTSDRYLDDILIHEHCVKVHVDSVRADYMPMPVPDEALREGVRYMKNTLLKFIQWPRKAIKILDEPTQTRPCDLMPAVELYTPEVMRSAEAKEKQAKAQVTDRNKPKAKRNKETQAKKSKGKGKEKQAEALVTDAEKQAQKVSLALKVVEIREEWYQNMVRQLGAHIRGDWATTFPFSAHENMFPTEAVSFIEAEAILALFANEWVDLTIVFWFTSYFYKLSKKTKLNRCAFFNVNAIIGDLCKTNPKEVEEHILN